MSGFIGNSFIDDITICSLEESGISFEELHSFIIRVFKERLAQGLNFKVSNSTLDGFLKYLQSSDSHVFVAIDNKTQNLVGTSTIIIRSKKRMLYGHHGLWAVSLQGRGIGTGLVKKEIGYAKARGVKYVESDTAERAVSSVYAHLKSGFVKAGYYSFPFTNYYSVYYRQYCGESRCRRFFYHHFVYPMRFCLYYVYTRVTKECNGADTRILRALKRVFRHV